MAADPDEATRRASTTLQEQGWSVREERDVPGGRQVLADGDGLAASVAVYEVVAGRTPPSGGVWVQVAVAARGEGPAWSIP